ncbi:MAG TPA: hypothetical protein VGO21_04200, partial [Candidatus Paceibacterota bacterium]|nr:hypothetical protein [Candidatus Paceibacterota bacterium]
KRVKETKSIAYLTNIQNQLKIYAEILRLFDDFTQTLREMNVLAPAVHKENDFSQLEAAIKKQIEQDNSTQKNDSLISAKNEKNQKIEISNTGIVSNGTVKIKGKYVSGRDIKINKQK